MSTTSILQVHMPIPGTANAPYFNGKYPSDFLEVLVQHGANAGITDLDNLVPYIVQYSSDEVKDLIRYMPEFDPDETGKTYAAAKTQLLLLFGQSDQPPNYTETMLREFCREHSAKSPFKNKVQIETYLKEFMKLAGPLTKQKKITAELRDYYFVTGLPSSIKEWFNSQVPIANRKRSSPPSITASISILQKRFDSDSLLFEPWKDDTETRDRKVKFDIDGKRIECSSRPNTRPPTPVPATHAPPAATVNAVEDLTKLLENLSLNLALLNSANQAQNVQHNQGNQGVPAAGTNTNTSNFPRRCFMCGKSGTHPLHPSRCPETKTLLDTSLIKFDTIRGRYTMPDGNDLPRAPSGFIGGVADYIRAQIRDQAQAQAAARTNSISLSYSNEPILKGDVFAVSSIGFNDYHADPVTRTGKDTNRHDPVGKSDRGKKKQVDIRDPPPHIAPTQPVPGPSKAKDTPTTIPPPQNPINRPDGWKGSLPSNRKPRDDVEMKDAPRKADKSTPSYHFTSDVQEMADPKLILQKVFDVDVSIPLFQLIGLSPQLQKLLGEATRVRREYGTKSAEYSFHDSDDFEEEMNEVVTAAHTEVITNQRRVFVQNLDRLPEFLTRYGNAMSRVPEKRFFAMTTGSMTVTIGGVDFTAMIDCGSELNLAGKSVPMRASLAVDFEGMKWSLKGIHGNPEQLQGCATDVPMRIGRHEFPHHLFVSHQELGPHDIILGQPFLQWFASRIDYERNGAVSLYLWKDGDRKVRPTVVISITDPSDPRNTTTITTRGHSGSSAWVEEVTDEEDF
ncbi:hypothetical protein C8R45DRAFT_1160278 [Mycena sanguinolenta]|nr:hypothetical protein C8R45DRAFT_1160278 [Mycena sanguinolenta]